MRFARDEKPEVYVARWKSLINRGKGRKYLGSIHVFPAAIVAKSLLFFILLLFNANRTDPERIGPNTQHPNAAIGSVLRSMEYEKMEYVISQVCNVCCRTF